MSQSGPLAAQLTELTSYQQLQLPVVTLRYTALYLFSVWQVANSYILPLFNLRPWCLMKNIIGFRAQIRYDRKILIYIYYVKQCALDIAVTHRD